MVSDAIGNATLAERVCDKLRGEILNKTIKAGERITIKEVSERFGVSNMPVREAFRVLEGESLLQMMAYKGAVVMQIDERFIRDLYGVLRGIECVMYEGAIPNVTEEIIGRMKTLNGEMSKTRDTEEDRVKFVELNSSFHEMVLNLDTNRKAKELYDYNHHLISSFRKNEGYTPSFERIRNAVEEHDLLIAIAENQDISGIKQFADRHSEGAMVDFLKQYTE